MNNIAGSTFAAAIPVWLSGRQPARRRRTPITPDLARLADGKGAQVFNRALTAASRGRPHRGAPGRAGRRRRRPAGRHPAQRGRDRGRPEGQGRRPAELPWHRLPRRRLDDARRRLLPAVQLPRPATAERRSHSVQYVSHPANTWQRLRTERPGQFEQAIDPPPDPERLVPRAHRPGERQGRGLRERRGEAEPVRRRPRADEERRRGAVRRQRLRRRVRQSHDHADRAGWAAARKHAEHLPGFVHRQPRPRAGARGSRSHSWSTRGTRTASRRSMPRRSTASATTAEYLLAKGADPNAVARHSGTPLDVAYEAGQTAFVAWLESRGARFTPLRFDVVQVAPAIRRVAFPWGMMNNVLVFSGSRRRSRDRLRVLDARDSTN